MTVVPPDGPPDLPDWLRDTPVAQAREAFQAGVEIGVAEERQRIREAWLANRHARCCLAWIEHLLDGGS